MSAAKGVPRSRRCSPLSVFDVFSAFYGFGEHGDEVTHFCRSAKVEGVEETAAVGWGLPPKQLIEPAGSRKRSFREKPVLRVLYSRNLSNFLS
jgi:hypothetical protein